MTYILAMITSSESKESGLTIGVLDLSALAGVLRTFFLFTSYVVFIIQILGTVTVFSFNIALANLVPRAFPF